MLTDDQELQLINGRECALHTHSFSAVATAESGDLLDSFEKETVVSAAYTVTYEDDLLLCNAGASGFIVSLRQGKAGKRYTIIKVQGVGNVTIQSLVGQTINGTASLVISSNYSPVRLKYTEAFGWVTA